MPGKIRVGIVGATVTEVAAAGARTPTSPRCTRCPSTSSKRSAPPTPTRPKHPPRRSAPSSPSTISRPCSPIRTSTWWSVWFAFRATTPWSCRRWKPARTSSASGRSAPTWPRPRRWPASPKPARCAPPSGLQAHSDPSLLYVRELIRDGYIGEVLAVNFVIDRSGDHRARRRPHLAGRSTQRRQHADDRRRPRHRRAVLHAGRVRGSLGAPGGRISRSGTTPRPASTFTGRFAGLDQRLGPAGERVWRPGGVPGDDGAVQSERHALRDLRTRRHAGADGRLAESGRHAN